MKYFDNEKIYPLIESIKTARNKYLKIDIKKTSEASLLTQDKYPTHNIGGGLNFYDHNKFFEQILPTRIDKLCNGRKYVLALNLLYFCYTMKLYDAQRERRRRYIFNLFVCNKSNNVKFLREKSIIINDIFINNLRNMLIKIYCFIGDSEELYKIYKKHEKELLDSDILEHIIGHFIKTNNIEEAKNVFEKLEKIDPFLNSIEETKVLIKRLELIETLNSKNIDFEIFNKLDGTSFEKFIVEQFKKSGFMVKGTPATGDYGADIIVETQDGTIAAVQCKRFSKKVNLKAVQEVVASLSHYSADFGIVISNNKFLKSAIKLAESNDIELWDGDKLLLFLNSDRQFSRLFEE